MVVWLVGAGDVVAPAKDLVEDHRQRRRDGADEAGLAALVGQHLLRRRQPEVADEAAQLGFAEVVVTAQDDHDGVSLLPARS